MILRNTVALVINASGLHCMQSAHGLVATTDLTTAKHTGHLVLHSSGACASIVSFVWSSGDSLSTTYTPGAQHASIHAKGHVLQNPNLGDVSFT